MNHDILIGIAGAAILHAVALFATVPVTTPRYEVIVAPSAMEVSLVAQEERIAAPAIMPEIPEVQREEIVAQAPQAKETQEKTPPEPNTKQGATSDAQPIMFYNQPPVYPREARRRGYEGRVILEALVSKEGTVAWIKVFQSSSYEILDRQAAHAIGQWVFAPARLFGSPIEQRVTIPVRFELQ